MSKFLFLSAKIPTRNPNLEDFLNRQLAYFSNYWSLSQGGEVWFVGLNGFIKLKKEENSAEIKVEIFSGFKCLPETRLMLRKLDLISSQSPWIDGAFSLILGKILNVSVVVQMHFEPKLVENKLLKKYFMKLVIHLSNHVRLVSKSQLKFTSNLASKSQIIPVPCVLPNRVTLQSLETRKFDVIFFGRLHPEKGVSQFIQVLSSLEKLLSLRVLIVGEGPMKKDIAAYLKSRGSSGVVEFIPWTSRENLFNLIRESRLHLNLSPTESFGLSFIEAAACGTPSLASSTSGAKEISQYIPSIYFLKSNDARLIAQEIVTLLQDARLMADLQKLIPEYNFLKTQFSDFTAWPIFLKSLIDTPEIISKGNHP